MRRGMIILGFCLAALSGGALLLYTSSTGKESLPSESSRIIAVKRGPVQARVAETGTLEPARVLEIKSQVSGEIRQLLIAEGQQVQQGQPLAIIQQEPVQARQVAQVRATLEEELVNVEQNARALKRMQRLLQKGFVAQQDLETAQINYRQAKVRRDLAKRQLLLALGGNQELYKRYLARDLSTDKLEEFVISSPDSGTILQVLIQPGELITSGTGTFGGGTVLMTLADLTHMIVNAKVNEVHIGRVTVGQAVDVRLDALPEKTFKGLVRSISPQGEKADTIVTYQVRIEIENTDQSLRPLMTANVDILTTELSDVIALPLEALRAEHGEDIVYVMENGGRTARKVRVSLRTESQAVIVQGLQEGETVVIPSYQDNKPHG